MLKGLKNTRTKVLNAENDSAIGPRHFTIIETPVKCEVSVRVSIRYYTSLNPGIKLSTSRRSVDR